VLGAAVLITALCVTLVGIPFAIMSALFFAVAAVAGFCAVLATAGALVLGHRTKSPYVHLAAGCIGLLVLGAIPYLGGVLYAIVFLIGIGALVSTGGAGVVRPKSGNDLRGSHLHSTLA
jgi:hypothetical protein